MASYPSTTVTGIMVTLTRKRPAKWRLWIALACVFGFVGRPVAPTFANAPTAGSLPVGGTVRFDHLTIEEGLSQNAGLALLQDRSGYLWIGTQDGLDRYDGYGFTVFRHDPEDPTSLGHNSVIALMQDSAGQIWVGTWGGGLNRYDPQTGRFTRFEPDAANPGALSHGVVTGLLQTSDGTIWVGTLGGLDRFDPATGGFTHFRHDPADATSLSADAVSTLYEDASQRLWVGTGAFGTPGAGLNLFDPTRGGFVHFQHDPTNPNSLAGDNVSAIRSASDGRLWVGLGGFSLPGAGLDLLDPATGRATHHVHDEADASSLSSDNVFSLLVSDDGHVWAGTWGGGLNEMNPAEPGRFTRYAFDLAQPHSLSGNEIWSLLQDRSGVIWAGTTRGGVNKLTPHSRDFRLFESHPEDADGLASNQIGAFAEDPAGGIWMATWGSGLDHFDPQTGWFRHYRYDAARAEGGVRSDMVMSLHVDADGIVWVGTLGAGLDRLDPATGAFTHYAPNADDPAALADGSVSSIVVDAAGRMWLGTLGGLHRYDPDRDAFVRYRADPARLGALSLGQVVSLAVDGDVLWVGTWGGGANRLDLADPANLDPALAQFTTYARGAETGALSDDNVWAIQPGEAGVVWLATQGGLNRLDPATGDVRAYGEREGLRNTTVLSAVPGAAQDLWLTTNNGLARFDIQTEQFQVYDTSDGLASNEFNSGAWLRTRAGLIYVGTSHGFNVFDPAALTPRQAPPPVVLTDFQVLNVSVPHTGVEPITLTYDQSFIAFEFAALDFSAPARNRFAYRLEGYDPDWIEAGTRRYASYTNLPGGSYTLRVRAANSEGVWSDPGLVLPVTITPPYWETWWFRGLLIVALVLAVLAGVQLRLRSTRNRNRQLEHLVQQRTDELERSNRLLQQKAAEEAVVAERTRLARDLHDAVTQTLFATTLIAEVLPQVWETDRAAGVHRLEELRQLTRGALAEMRSLLVELRPNALTEVPLPGLLRQLGEAAGGRARLSVQVQVDGDRPLPPDVQLMLYRITQEALNNIVKHARASQAVVQLRLGPSVRLTIADTGVGFDPSAVTADHLGLRIMRERAEAVGARVTLYSEPGAGTQITVVWEEPA